MIEARVYWTDDKGPCCRDFPDDLGSALKFTEELRQRSQAGEVCDHVVLSTIDTNCTSLRGVAAPSPDYNWTKRRSELRHVDRSTQD